jgi:hypothetical protein
MRQWLSSAHHGNLLQCVSSLINIAARLLDLGEALRQPRPLDLHIDLHGSSRLSCESLEARARGHRGRYMTVH